MKSTLRALSDLISQSVDAIEAQCDHSGVKFPSLDDPFSLDSESVRKDPEIVKEIGIAASAAFQLLQTLRPPHLTMLLSSASHCLSASLNVVNEVNVADILREAGSKGLHVDVIAKKAGLDPKKLARILRYLSTHHVFIEVSPNVFSNNRLSSVMDKGLAEDTWSSLDKYESPRSVGAAMVGHLSDETLKAGGHLTEVLLDPTTAFSGEPRGTALSRFANGHSYFEFLEEPGNEMRLKRFGTTMNIASALQPSNLVTEGFDWASLSTDSVVVDVGGGIGAVSMTLAEIFSHLKFIVQDRAQVVKEGMKLCQSSAYRDGRLSFQAHDFFEAQPVKNASVYFLRHINHDWSDEYVYKILRNLREAAAPNSRLVTMDTILPYACKHSGYANVPGLSNEEVPQPLLANLGGGMPLPYFADMLMLLISNGQERTIDHSMELFLKAGWKIERVRQTDSFGHFLSLIVAAPV